MHGVNMKAFEKSHNSMVYALDRYGKDNVPDYISKEFQAIRQKRDDSQDEIIITMGESRRKVREYRKSYGIDWHKWYEIDKKKKPSKRFLQKNTDAFNFYFTTYNSQTIRDFCKGYGVDLNEYRKKHRTPW